jgi:glucose-6-phosphate isomerase
MDRAKTLVIAIAKSGGTAETVSTFLIVREWLNDSKRIAAITIHGKGNLFDLAKHEAYRTFSIPENVCGRFSVLDATIKEQRRGIAWLLDQNPRLQPKLPD